MDLVMVGNRFDHKIWTVANVSVRAKKHGANTDGQQVIVEARVPEQVGDLNLFGTDFLAREVRKMILLQREISLADRFRDAGEIRSAVLHEVLNRLEGVLINKGSEDGVEKTQVGRGIVQHAREESTPPVEKDWRRIAHLGRVRL